MTHTIEDLWNGNIAPCDWCGAHDPEIRDLFALMTRHQEALNRELPQNHQEMFQKYIDCSEEYTLRMMEHAFCEGFRLASELLTESLSEGA